MSTADNNPASRTDDCTPIPWQTLLKRLALWSGFFALLYLARDFFFAGFMTFMISYLTLALVSWAMRRLSPHRDRPRLRRLLTVAVFVLFPLVLFGFGVLLGPRLVEQGQHLASWLGHVDPETEIYHAFENFVGRSEFKSHYGTPQDPRYQKGLEEFRKGGERHVDAYNAFPDLEAWVEGGFRKQFTDNERNRILLQLRHEGTSSQEFTQWFLADKVPELQEQARKQLPAKGRPPEAVGSLVQAAAKDSPEQLLVQARRDPALLADLQAEWFRDELAKRLAEAKHSAAYQQQFHAYYDDQRERSPQAVPFTFEQYVELQRVRPQGKRAFGDAVEKMKPTQKGETEAQLRADFEATEKHQLFQQWWSTSSIGKLVRREVEGGGGDGEARLQRVVSSVLNIPIDLGTALLLSFFICIDFPRLRSGVRRLRQTWLRDVYEEFAPVLAQQATLIGRAMHAQGLIALCNAVLLFVALTWFGVVHAVLLSVAVFVFCLVPTLGTLIAWALIIVVAMIQPGGGFALALKASGAVVLVVLMETFVFSPRILGRMMELHPVLIIALLPLAQYFFGVWGLLLATPVAVYVIHVAILRRGLPGKEAGHEPPGTGEASLPAGKLAEAKQGTAVESAAGP